MTKKLSAKNILISLGVLELVGASISLGVSYIIGGEFLYTLALVNGIGNVPLWLAASDALRQELGLRSPIQILGGDRKSYGRRIPVNTANGTQDIFMSALRLPSGQSNQTQPLETVRHIETISIWYDNNEYTLTIPELEDFVHTVWRIQRQNTVAYRGLSREYWTTQHRPRLRTLEYNIRVWVLMSCDGLILDRGPNRSGRLTVPPNEAMKIIKAKYL